MYEFFKFMGPLATVFFILMIAFTVTAIATNTLGLMIPAMILGVIALFTINPAE